MKKLLLYSFLAFSISVNAQSKKELQAEVDRLNTECTSIKNDLKTTRAKLDEARGKYEGCLEDKEGMMDRQTELMNQNLSLKARLDSLEAAFTEVASGVISNPKNQADSIKMAIQQYYTAGTAEDRFKFVYDNGNTLAILKKVYAKGARVREIKAKSISIGSPVKNFLVAYAMNYTFYIKLTDLGYRLDWETTFGYNETSLIQVQNDLSNKEMGLRLNCELANYYNYNYNGKERQYYSIKLRSPSGGKYAAGFVSRSSSVGKRIYELLSDGKTHSITIKVKPDRTQDKSGTHMLITQLVSDTWIID
tara:strand:+ start:104 stop:1021 length:918 start_codon:yes stop_codon:yes gene_type:complete